MSYIDALGDQTRQAIVARAATVAVERLDYSDEEYVNETRANWGQAAVMVGCPDYARGGNGIYTDVKDALTNIVHFMHRAGLDPEQVFDAALFGAEGDLEDGNKVRRDNESFPEDD